MKHGLFRIVALAALGAAVVSAQSRPHELHLTPENVHWGYYDSRLAPVLRIASGDRVRVETMVAGGLQRLRLAGATEAEIPESLKLVEQRVTDRGPGVHPMTGPIFVTGAEPGDTLEVQIGNVEFLHNFGVNAFSPGGGVLPDDYPYARLKLLRWSTGATRVQFAPGITLPLAPFFGSIGVAPPQDASDETDYRIPDLTFVAAGREQLLGRDGVRGGGPDAVFEIRSADDETYEKIPFFARLGVREVVVIDRDTKSVEIFRLAGPQYVTVQPTRDGWLGSETLRVRFSRTPAGRLAIEDINEPSTRAEM